MTGSVKRDHKSENVNFEIFKHVVDDCLTSIFLKKADQKSVKMAELGYFEIGRKKTAF